MENWKRIWDGLSVDATMHQLLERTRQCRGIAMEVCGQTMDYEAFHKRSDAAAAWLQKRNYRRGSIVIVSMRASLDLFCMMAAVIKAGLVVTVTEDDIPDARLQKLHAQTNAVLRITDADAEGIFDAGSEMEMTNITDTVSPDDVYAIWYTSGTTGEPCGIQTMARNTVCSIIPEPGNEILSGCLKECSALLNISHPSFGVGFTNFFYALFYGIRFVHIQMGQEDSIREIARSIRENPGCFLLFTPSAVAACMEDEHARASFVHCKAVMMGADQVSQTLMHTVQEALGPEGKVINLYGISDVGLVAAKLAGKEDKPHVIGKPTAYTSFLVVDEDRRPLPQGEPGEFCITGIRVGPGYLKAEGEKANKFVRGEDGQGYFYTGDYGYIGEDGQVYLLGRVDRRIKHLGFRVDATEIEEALRKKAHVRSAAVKQFEEAGRQTLCAFYEGDQAWNPDELRALLAEDLPRYCLPERFIHMEALPLTERGKLDYRALTLPAEDADRRYEAPETDAERAICAAFETVLKTKRVGRTDSFFELGGDSVRGTLVLALLGEKYSLHYTIVDLFRNPKPMELARVSAAEKREDGVRTEGTILLPPELKELAGQDGIEAIYPPDLNTAHFAFLEEVGSAYSSGVLYFNLRADLRRSFSKSEIEQRVSALTRRHPVLRSFFVRDQAGKQWQVFRREGDAPVWYRDLSGMETDARERFFSGFFQVMNEAKAPFQVACFPTGEDSCTLLLRLMHTQADGVSCVILLNELAGEIPEGQDAFYAYREKRLRSRSDFPEELQEYYRAFGDLCRLPATATAGVRKTDVRRILLTGEQTGRLQERCGKKGLTFAGYTEYCFGRGLLRVLGRASVWFSHIYSGRDDAFAGSEGIVGDMICALPVRIREGMSAESFQKALLVPWKYPYVTDTEAYRRLNLHNIERGVVSRIFPPLHENITFFTDYPENSGEGLYLDIRDGQLEVVLRYPAGEKEKHNLDILEDTVRELLLQGP